MSAPVRGAAAGRRGGFGHPELEAHRAHRARRAHGTDQVGFVRVAAVACSSGWRATGRYGRGSLSRPQPYSSATAVSAIAHRVSIVRPMRRGNLARTATAFRASELRRSLSTAACSSQVVDVLFPEARLAEPRKGARKGRVRPALRNPGGMVEHARGAQHLDEAQLRRGRWWQSARSRPAIRPTGAPRSSGLPARNIHRSWIAGPFRQSSRSTNTGPCACHRMLPRWQSPCSRIGGHWPDARRVDLRQQLRR